jgi:hypothetical protein
MATEGPRYYRDRAAEERSAADSAPNRGIFRFHDEMAAMYERKAREAERSPEPELELELAD